MPKFEHRETVTIRKRPRKKRKKAKSPVSTKVRKHHGTASRVIKPSQSQATKQMLDADLNALAEASAIPIDALKRIKANNPGMFIMLTNSFMRQTKTTLQ